MPVLPNPKHEAFCQARAIERLTIDAAYSKAGYSPSRTNASRLSSNDHIQARISELQGEVAEKAVLSRADLLSRLENFINDDPRRFYHPDGRPKAIHELDDSSAQALAGWEENVLDTGLSNRQSNSVSVPVIMRTRKIRRTDKIRAAELYARIAGHLRDPAAGGGGGQTIEQLVLASMNVTVNNVTVHNHGVPSNGQKQIEAQALEEPKSRRRKV